MSGEITTHNPERSYIPEHPYKIIITGSSGSGKTNAFLNLINDQLDLGKKYLYSKDPYNTKYEFLSESCKKVELKRYNDLKVFIEYSNGIQDVYKYTRYKTKLRYKTKKSLF